MTADDGKSYVGYLNKLADEYSNTYHRSISKNPIHESSDKAPWFKVVDGVRISKYKNIFNKDYTVKRSKGQKWSHMRVKHWKAFLKLHHFHNQPHPQNTPAVFGTRNIFLANTLFHSDSSQYAMISQSSINADIFSFRDWPWLVLHICNYFP